MHDVLEGVVVREMSLLLHYSLRNKFISLADYDRLLNFDYDYTEISTSADLQSFANSVHRELKLSASQSLLLCRIFPFLIADWISEDDYNWSVFLVLKHIVDIVMCPEVSIDTCLSEEFNHKASCCIH